MINVNEFISSAVTHRQHSLLTNDIARNHSILESRINGRSVLVIGGAGTIGSSFIRAILPFKPSKLVVVDINENGLTELTRTLRSTHQMFVPEQYLTYPISYSEPVFEKMFRIHQGFDIVANFSAHKHVRSEKDAISVEALLNNNVIRAKHLMDLLCAFPPQHFFCVSTDKAANPVNIMGASKKIMEDMIMAYADRFPVTTARFANVAFSNGSLLAGFIERMSQGQPLSAPSDVKRYFVSPEESGQICMMACLLGNSGDVFFPKLSEAQMMTFSSIATNLLEYLGYTPHVCESEEQAKATAAARNREDRYYPVYYFESDTTGEKAYEEFYTEDEIRDLNRFEALGVLTDLPKRSVSELNQLFEELNRLFSNPSCEKTEIVEVLSQFLPNFDHEEKGKSLDSKM